MKKYLLLVMISLSTVAYTQANKIVTTMSPTDRHNLFLSTTEVADAYNSLGRTKKANSFYRSAISIYPIGDQAHQLANRFNMPLDDETTYTNFVVFGDTKFENQQYRIALYSYLMADELDNSPVLYQKIASTYEALENPAEAAFYQELGKNANTEAPTDYTDIEEPTYLEDETTTYDEGMVETQDMEEPTYAEENMVETEDIMTTEAVETEETMTPDTQNTEDMDATDEVMTLEVDVETEDTLFEEAVSETNAVNTDDLNDIMKVDYEEQLN